MRRPIKRLYVVKMFSERDEAYDTRYYLAAYTFELLEELAQEEFFPPKFSGLTIEVAHIISIKGDDEK